jgi:hypothetical protein
VSGRASVWELKGLIESHGLGRSVTATGTTLLQGPQVLEDAASLHNVGVVDGTMLTVILASKYNLLVAMHGGDMELWNHEGKVEHTCLKDCGEVRDVAFSPDNNFVLSAVGDSIVRSNSSFDDERSFNRLAFEFIARISYFFNKNFLWFR